MVTYSTFKVGSFYCYYFRAKAKSCALLLHEIICVHKMVSSSRGRIVFTQTLRQRQGPHKLIYRQRFHIWENPFSNQFVSNILFIYNASPSKEPKITKTLATNVVVSCNNRVPIPRQVLISNLVKRPKLTIPQLRISFVFFKLLLWCLYLLML